MSGHYSAGQYNDAFKARPLRNWQYGINHPGKFSSHRKCPTQFIADNRGYLLSDALKDKCTSPWGDYQLSIWEDKSKCDCVDRIRNHQNYDRPPCNIIVPRQRPQPVKEAKRTSADLAKVLFQPPPKPEVSVIVKDDEEISKPKDSCCGNDNDSNTSFKSGPDNSNNNNCSADSNSQSNLSNSESKCNDPTNGNQD